MTSFSKEEDERIIELVKKYKHDYKKIAAVMRNSRNAKQLRERYTNHLADGIKLGEFTPEEEKTFWKLFHLHNSARSRWKLIADEMEGRTALQVRNYYYNYQRKSARRIKKQMGLATILN
ncbi:2216_t:CDS:2 [Paraglomus brasilianum]|uniref:2216_t:CDS:1 n=1 Tax=Paraglomus brasilianum TaxID=144538 RepID=A0A9N8Z4Q4_9GLOM|nr:2216_t:CDS:2 [Paraglomus brasilianum]